MVPISLQSPSPEEPWGKRQWRSERSKALHVLKLSVRVKATAKMARCPSGAELLGKGSGGKAPVKDEILESKERENRHQLRRHAEEQRSDSKEDRTLLSQGGDIGERRQPPSGRSAGAAISRGDRDRSRPLLCPFGIAKQAFSTLNGDPTNPKDTLFLFVFFPCQVSGLTELPWVINFPLDTLGNETFVPRVERQGVRTQCG